MTKSTLNSQVMTKINHEFEKIINWIKSQRNQEVNNYKDRDELIRGIFFELFEDLKTLNPVKEISLIVLDQFKENELNFWFSLTKDPESEKKLNLPLENKISVINYHLLSFILQSYLLRNGLEFIESSSTSLFSDWFVHLNREFREYRAESYISNFEMDSEVLNLSDDVFIKKLSEEEKQRIYEYSFKNPLFPNLTHLDLDFVLVRNWKKPINFTKPINTSAFFKRDLSIFRLIKPNWIVTGDFINFREVTKFSFGQSTSSPNLYRSKQGGEKYKILKDKEKEFISEWQSLNQLIPEYYDFPIWLRRYQYSYDRDRPEDALIDLMIILESFFSSGRSEMTHKISTRAAVLLAIDYTDKEKFEIEKEYKNKIKDFYSLRSAIVHGEDKKVSSENVQTLREYIRLIIKKLNHLEPNLFTTSLAKFREKLHSILDFKAFNVNI